MVKDTTKIQHQDSEPRRAKLFRNGKNQAVRLPKEYEINAREVIIRKQGSDIILTPKPSTWDDYFDRSHRLLDDFPNDIDDLTFETRDEL